ncbi:MAG: GNAT family N-acetyltransferase [Rhodobacterales bacterium]|nr:GNAT family N-acetyltransferase [Rhodobacterales bacterium]
MPGRVIRLTPQHEAALQELLEQDLVVNLFLMGFLAAHPMDRAWWIGTLDGERLVGCLLMLPGRLVVPFAPDDAVATQLGKALKGAWPPMLLVGPRGACDQLWHAWGSPVKPVRWYDQRLYNCETASTATAAPDLRRAQADEWEQIAAHSARMEREDIGLDPMAADPDLHTSVVQERISAGRTWVIKREGQIVFQINVGTSTPWGCQVGGTWVPPEHRGKGLATAGVAALTHKLLAEHTVITLHVNEANTPAVRCYERNGFMPNAAYRLATMERG